MRARCSFRVGLALSALLAAGCTKDSTTSSPTAPAQAGRPPVAGTVSVNPANPVAGQLVTLAAVGAADPDGRALTFAWTFGDGQTGTGQTTTHAYAAAGTFAITLTVSNGAATATAAASVAVRTNSAPSAGSVVVSKSPAIAGTTVTLASQGASDPDGQTLTFSWAFGDGTTGTGQSIGHVYGSPGTFTVTVTVSDGQLSSSASTSVVVKSLTGTWRGALVIDAVIILTQSGTTLSGTFNSINLTGSISGSIDRTTLHVSFTITVPGFASFTYSGDPDSAINALTGTVSGSGFVNEAWTLRRT